MKRKDDTGSPEEDILMSASEAADYLRMTRGALYAAVHRRQIPYVKWGNRLRFSLSALQHFLAAHTVPAEDEGELR